MVINAVDYAVIPDTDVSESLNSLLGSLSGKDGDKELIITPGTYFLTAENCKEDILYITNTVGDKEFSKNETPHKARVGLYLKDISDLTVRAQGAVFVLDGKMTNMAVINCRNIVIDGLEIRHKNPDMHEFKVISKTRFSVDFMLDSDSRYTEKNGKYYFTGRDYETGFFQDKHTAWGWFGKISADNENHICRKMNPFLGEVGFCEIKPYHFRAKYLNTGKFTVGEKYCIFNNRRQYVGIFADKTENLTLKNIAQRFDYSLALVVQDSENITVDSVDFSPAEGQAKQLVSLADFMQFSMCRGKVTVENSYFCGAGDDCLNVHGIHFKIVRKRGDKLTVRFKHSQTHGFNPLRVGDSIEYVDPKTLLPSGNAKIISSVLVNEKNIELTVDNAEKARVGDVIEDTSACPELLFRNNRMTRIITRGILVTTRGRVVIDGNDFDDTEMAAILFSDDAKSWYESGRCTDVTITNNRFGSCGAYSIQILPENGRTGSVVHGSFLVRGNRFESDRKCKIDAHSSKSLTLLANTGLGKTRDSVRAVNIQTCSF